MRRKAIALLLVLAMALAMCPMALAAGTSDVRTTNFFTDYNADLHTDLKFSDIKTTVPDVAAVEKTAEEVRGLMNDAANAAVVEEKVNEVLDAYMMALTMANIAEIRGYQNYNSNSLWNTYYDISDASDELYDIACGLVGEVLPTPCGGFLKKIVPSGDQQWYIDYAAWLAEAAETTDDDTGDVDSDDPYSRESDLLNGYYDVLYKYSYNHDWYEEMAEIYVQMLRARAEIAADNGYDNYAEYAYDYVYWREYTPDEIQSYENAIKTYIAPLYERIYNLCYDIDYTQGVFVADYTGDVALDAIEPYIGQMSSELLYSFQYMREHEMYDLSVMNAKSYYGAYTTYFYSYGTPFVFSGEYDPDDGIYNFSTAVHEFGHYNADFYNEGMEFFTETYSIDLAEVHSQGLELLMTHYYPEIFGSQSNEVTVDQMRGFLSTLMYNALLDELETYAYKLDVDKYTDEELMELIGNKYYELNAAYYGDTYTPSDNLEWSYTGHLFWSPCYVISYSVSLAGAFNFWLDAQNDFFPAVDDYLEFCALPNSLSFVESFEKVGLSNPLTPEYVADLAAKLDAETSKLAVPIVGSFTDLTAGAWYIDAVSYVYENGLMNGTTATSFDPNGTLNRAMLAQILYNLAGKPEVTESGLFTDVADSAWYADPINWAASEGIVTGYEDGTFQPTKSITRQELAVMLWRYEGSPESEGSLDSFKDANNVLAYAKDALVWAVANGVVNGYDNGTLQPKANSTRAVVAQMLMNLLADAAEAEE